MPEFEPLLAPGFHDIPLSQLDAICVHPFNNPDRRTMLLERFRAFLEAFAEFQVPAEIWVDGSFSTMKEEPGDIDALLVLEEDIIAALDQETSDRLFELLNRETAKVRYHCDILLCAAADQNNRSYWRGWFGFDRDESPKGIIRFHHVAN